MNGAELGALADGEVGLDGGRLAAHVGECALCRSRLAELAALREAAAEHRALRASSLNPLAAARAVRRRPAAVDQLGWARRALSATLWAWTFHRPWCCLALAVGAALPAGLLAGLCALAAGNAN